MFCVNCGVKLDDSEKSCPLCGTSVYHPEIKQGEKDSLFPKNKKPNAKANSKVINELYALLFIIAAITCVFSDMRPDGRLNWFGFAAGGLLLFYIAFALPLWFKKRNPVIFVPCDFVAALFFLHYINWVTDGNWFLSFAFPVVGTLAVIVCAAVTLMRYLRRGKLYVWGGAFVALGALIVLIELMLCVTFGMDFTWWSFYPLAVMLLFGGFIFHLAISENARETLKRKLFF